MSKIGKLRKWTTQVIIGALVMFILVAALWWIFIPAFRQSSQGRGTLGASLCSRNFNFQIANPETRFELARDWFALLRFKCFGSYDGAIERKSRAVRKGRPLMDP